MNKISPTERDRIITLRREGKSIPEIVKISGSAQTTVQRYVQTVVVPHRFLKRLKEKQGGAKERAYGLRTNVMEEARNALSDITQRDKLLILAGIYWGEGTKKDFSIINSDPFLIQTVVHCLRNSLHISKERLWLSLRMHTDISMSKAKKFWSRTTGLPLNKITRIEVIEGKKKGKLQYGMCRVRVQSGIRERLFLQSIISLIGKESAERVVS